jgi:hypothetical protein
MKMKVTETETEKVIQTKTHRITIKKPKLMPFDKRQMLIDAIELSYKTGTARSFLVGHPLSWYDYHALWNLIVKLNKENIEQGGDDMFECCTASYQNCF